MRNVHFCSIISCVEKVLFDDYLSLKTIPDSMFLYEIPSFIVEIQKAFKLKSVVDVLYDKYVIRCRNLFFISGN